MDGWENFWLTTGGAAATLTGLLFVALSVNKDPIGGHLEHRSLARQTVGATMSILVVALLALVPEQPRWVFGMELTIGNGLLLVALSTFQWRTVMRLERGQRRVVATTVAYDAAVLVMFGAGVGLWLEFVWSPFVLVGSILLLGGVAMSNCWALVMSVDTPQPGPSTEPSQNRRRKASQSATARKP